MGKDVLGPSRFPAGVTRRVILKHFKVLAVAVRQISVRPGNHEEVKNLVLSLLMANNIAGVSFDEIGAGYSELSEMVAAAYAATLEDLSNEAKLFSLQGVADRAADLMKEMSDLKAEYEVAMEMFDEEKFGAMLKIMLDIDANGATSQVAQGAATVGAAGTA